MLLDSKRIVLPLAAVKPILQLLHSSHSGITKTYHLARGLYFWPGMTNDIKQLVSACADCPKVLPSQPSNPMSTPSPSTHFGFPMQHIGLDLFSFGNKEFLICVDHWSGYPFYSHLRSLSSSSVITTLTFSVGDHRLEVMVDRSFVVSSPTFARLIIFVMSCQLLTILNLTDLLRQE